MINIRRRLVYDNVFGCNCWTFEYKKSGLFSRWKSVTYNMTAPQRSYGDYPAIFPLKYSYPTLKQMQKVVESYFNEEYLHD